MLLKTLAGAAGTVGLAALLSFSGPPKTRTMHAGRTLLTVACGARSTLGSTYVFTDARENRYVLTRPRNERWLSNGERFTMDLPEPATVVETADLPWECRARGIERAFRVPNAGRYDKQLGGSVIDYVALQ